MLTVLKVACSRSAHLHFGTPSVCSPTSRWGTLCYVGWRRVRKGTGHPIWHGVGSARCRNNVLPTLFSTMGFNFTLYFAMSYWWVIFSPLQDSYLGDDFQLKSQADQVLSQDSTYQGDRGGYQPYSQPEFSQQMYNSQYWVSPSALAR